LRLTVGCCRAPKPLAARFRRQATTGASGRAHRSASSVAASLNRSACSVWTTSEHPNPNLSPNPNPNPTATAPAPLRRPFALRFHVASATVEAVGSAVGRMALFAPFVCVNPRPMAWMEGALMESRLSGLASGSFGLSRGSVIGYPLNRTRPLWWWASTALPSVRPVRLSQPLT